MICQNCYKRSSPRQFDQKPDHFKFKIYLEYHQYLFIFYELSNIKLYFIGSTKHGTHTETSCIFHKEDNQNLVRYSNIFTITSAHYSKLVDQEKLLEQN